jgi:hypothetical protein
MQEVAERCDDPFNGLLHLDKAAAPPGRAGNRPYRIVAL